MLLPRQSKPPANVPKAVLSPCTCGVATVLRICKQRGHLCDNSIARNLLMMLTLTTS